MTSLIENICEQHQIHCKNIRSGNGGDINQAYQVSTGNGFYFIKVNDAGKYPGMFGKEAEGLTTLSAATNLKVPGVIANGAINHHQYLVLEWLDKIPATGNFWQQFAQGLAMLHQHTNAYFGFASANYIGSLPQANEPANTWSAFYASQRLLPLVQQLRDTGDLTGRDVMHAENLCSRLNDIFPAEPPALLHGDLWSGNYSCVKENNGEIIPAIFDPAVYYGHREMDIGMTLLFGGFHTSMYEYYHNIFPLEKNWQQRVPLTQLYPLLVHAILFGGRYISSCRSIINNWK